MSLAIQFLRDLSADTVVELAKYLSELDSCLPFSDTLARQSTENAFTTLNDFCAALFGVDAVTMLNDQTEGSEKAVHNAKN